MNPHYWSSHDWGCIFVVQRVCIVEEEKVGGKQDFLPSLSSSGSALMATRQEPGVRVKCTSFRILLQRQPCWAVDQVQPE